MTISFPWTFLQVRLLSHVSLCDLVKLRLSFLFDAVSPPPSPVAIKNVTPFSFFFVKKNKKISVGTLRMHLHMIVVVHF